MTSIDIGTVDIRHSLDLAVRMADRADRIAMSGFGADHAIETKPDGTPVTRVDKEVESALREMIEDEQPAAGVLGEEYGEKPGIGRWVIDPIDGTISFMDGRPDFSILIAYEMAGESLVGVVSALALETRWWAGLGQGARVIKNGEVAPARVSRTSRMSESAGHLVDGFPFNGHLYAAGPSRFARALGATGFRPIASSVSWEAVRVASGELDMAFTVGAPWDVAPLPVIVDEAGGFSIRISDGRGKVAVGLTNRALADEVSRLLPMT